MRLATTGPSSSFVPTCLSGVTVRTTGKLEFRTAAACDGGAGRQVQDRLTRRGHGQQHRHRDRAWAPRDSNPARRIKSPVLYLMS